MKRRIKMNKVKIITDSCCSLSPLQLKNLDMDYLSMEISVNDEHHNSFNYPEKDPLKFYETLEKSQKCSTSCINTFQFTEKFEEYVKKGFDVFYIGLSGGLSSTYSNAKSAEKELNEKYGQHVWVADSQTGSFGIALMLEQAKKMADEGKTAQEIFGAIDKNNLKTYSIFAPGDLHFLRRSGRISKFVASVGSMLKIVPVIQADNKGELKLFSKSIGRKKALSVIKNFILEKGDLTSPQKIYIGHSGQIEEAKELAQFLKENTQNKDIEIGFIDYTMGCNCGPKTLAVFGFLKQ